MKALLLLALLFSGTTLLAVDATEQEKVREDLTSALKAQDRGAFYALVCFDGLNPNWIKTNKKVFDVAFEEAKKTPSFTGKIVQGTANILPPPSTQKYNLPLSAAYLMQLAPGLSLNLPLGVKDGKLRVACVLLKE